MENIIRLRMEDVAFGGKGVGRSEGKAVFVPFTIAGEEVSAQIVKQKKNFAEAALVEVHTASPHRVEPRCPYFGRCGGCAYQHIDYAQQLAIKQRQVEQTLARVGRLAHVPMQRIVGSPQSYAYRNRIRVHASDGTIGFFAYDRHALIDIELCPISSAFVNAKLTALRSRPRADGDYILSENEEAFFRQTNDEVAELLATHVEEIVARGQELLIDAYCGAGVFAKRLAPLFGRTVGIEENGSAIAEARARASENEHYLCGDVAAHLGAVLDRKTAPRITLVLDPPAIGLSPRVTDVITASPPAELVYVSCNPATLARDLGLLCRTFQLRSVTPFDMFPQTAEIEVVAHLTLPAR